LQLFDPEDDGLGLVRPDGLEVIAVGEAFEDG
jgi:hypothetical protein